VGYDDNGFVCQIGAVQQGQKGIALLPYELYVDLAAGDGSNVSEDLSQDEKAASVPMEHTITAETRG